MHTIPPVHSWPFVRMPLRRIAAGFVVAALLAAPHVHAQTSITIGGVVYEDIDGNSQLNDGVGRPNVNVRVYADPNNDGLSTGDPHIADTVTDADGRYSVSVAPATTGNRYFVAVDSRSITPSAGFNVDAGAGNVWAEQTYGDDWRTATLDLGSRFGGRDSETTGASNRSDKYNATSTTFTNTTYRHLALVDVTNGNITNLDWGFSFNVVTNMRAGSTDDDDTKANRTVQGSLRQFIQNANAVAGSNSMRFVPTVGISVANTWRVGVTSSLPALTNGGTTIDGIAYHSADGITMRDQNPGQFGTGGTVGTDKRTLARVNKPEFTIQGSSTVPIGINVAAPHTTIRNVAITGFGTSVETPPANVRVGSSASSVVIEHNIIGAPATAFTSPDPAMRSGGDNVLLERGSIGTISNNLIGFANGEGIQADSGAWTIDGNEIRGNGLNGVSVDGGTTSGNLIIDNGDAGVVARGGRVKNNTVRVNGRGGAAASDAGVRLDGADAVVQQNIITGNHGAGVLVQAAANYNTISQNTISTNGTTTNAAGSGPTAQIGIDLLQPTDDQHRGTAPFVTRNDVGDADGGGNNLQNSPVIERATVNGNMLTITGVAALGAHIELFVAAPDASGFGEAETYLLPLDEGSADDTDPSPGGYRFAFPVPAGVGQGTELTATTTVAGSTSEFGGNVTVSVQPTAVTLLGFAATSQDQNVVLQWATATERDTAGYYLLRSSDGTRAGAVPVSPLVPAHTPSMGDKQYTWTDEQVNRGTYTYWLQEVETGGATTEYGPVIVHVGTWHAFVPLTR